MTSKEIIQQAEAWHDWSLILIAAYLTFFVIACVATAYLVLHKWEDK